MRKSRIVYCCLAWIVCVTTVVGRADQPAPAQQPARVRTAVARERVLKLRVGVTGTVVADPARVATLSAQTAGFVSRLAVAEGTRVAGGDVVIELDEEKARIDRDRARAALARLIARPRAEDLEVARRAQEKAQATLDLVLSRLKASSSLRTENPRLVPPLQVQEQRRDVDVARAEVSAAGLQLRLLELGPKAEQRREAAVEVEAAELALKWCKVHSPLAGVVTEIKARVGLHVEPGTPLATVMDTSEVLIQARLPAQHLESVTAALAGSTGQDGPAVAVRAQAFPEASFQGRLIRLAPETEAQTGDVPLWARVANSRGSLRAGMTVQVEVPGREVRGIVIPETALSIDDQGHQVVTAVRDGKAAPQVIELAGDSGRSRVDGLVVVKSGLKDGDVVAVENGYALPEGYPVTTASPSVAATPGHP